MSLKKFLYGLKQVSRLWFAKFSTSIEVAGFALSKADYSLFTYQRGKFFVALLIYIDDIFITDNNSTTISTLKKFL
jgi:hypothetical protein